MKPYLWITYNYASTSECLSMLDAILEQHSNHDIIHEIGRSTLIQALLEGVSIVSDFRQRLNNYQTIIADFKGYDVPYGSGERFYYAALTDLVTVMATASNQQIRAAIQAAKTDQKLVTFDLMTCFDDDEKVQRAQELADLGASLVSCHTGWSQQVSRNIPTTLIEKVCHQLKNCSTRLIVTGGFKPSSVKELKPYVERNQIFAIAVGEAITRSKDPNTAIAQFLAEINYLVPCPSATVKEFYPPQFYPDPI